MNLSGRVALVTGAGGGIGRAIALSLARRGCHVALADINEAGLDEAAGAVRALGVKASAHRLDVTDRAAVAALPAAISAAHGRLDLLVNNAGVAIGGTFEQVSEEDFDWLMQVNFFSVVRLTRACLPLLHASDDARIVNISSLFGLISPPGQAAYSASKFAVRGFSNALRHEFEGSNIAVTVVHPGGVATDIAKNARVPAGAPPAEVERERVRMQKLLRMPPATAGEIIVKGIEARRARILVGTDAKIVSLIERFLPVSYWSLLKKGMRT